MRRSIVFLPPAWCSDRACHRIRAICSNTLWSRTRLMARYCASRDARFTLASPKPLRANSPTLWSVTPSSWRVTAPRRG